MKKFKKVLKIAALVLGVIVTVWLITNAIRIQITSKRLEEQLAKLRAAGDPVVLKDLARPPIPPDQDAGVYLRRARADIDAITRELRPVFESPEYERGRLTDAARKAIQSAFQAYPEVIVLLEKAAACPDYGSAADFTAGPQALQNYVLGEVQRFRDYAHVLTARARLLLAEGKREEALRSCLLMFRLTRHVEREPLSIALLVTLSCRSVAVEQTNAVLRSGSLPQPAHEELEKELALNGCLEGFRWALKSELVYAIESFGAFMNWGNRALFSDDECFLIESMSELQSLIGRPYAELATVPQKMAQGGTGLGQPLTRLTMPAIMKTAEATHRVRAQVHCLRVLNALTQRGDRLGTSIPPLSELGLSPEAITDPYTGSPLQIKKVPGGWLIYSVGSNLMDDGGDLTDRKDVGLGPVNPK